jgi:transglutaminase-like putative cysteine protease
MYRLIDRRGFLTAATGLLVFSSAPAQEPAQRKPNSLVKYGKPEVYRSRHLCLIDAKNADVDSLESWLPVPTNWGEQQISRIAITPTVEPVAAKNGETKIARWLYAREQIGANAAAQFVVETEWKRFEISTDLGRLQKQKFLPYDEESADYKTYIGTEKDVQSDYDRIADAANKIKGSKGKDRPWAHIAFDLYSWVLDRTTFQGVSWQGAKLCFDKGSGGCGDYSALFVAACRAVGIPARLNAGYWAAEKNGVHVWAEFMLPSGEWVPVDASIGDQSVDKRAKFFGFLDNNRITMSKTADVHIEPIGDSMSEVTFFQIGAFSWRGRSAPSIRFEFAGTKARGR